MKRAYEPAAREDGTRVLVNQDVAPSTALRRWFGHDPARWTEFRRRYRADLAQRTDLLNALPTIAGKGPLTLIYSARDVRHNQAVVLRERLVRS
ncbi:MAG TPA: DUF488 family protein [Stellaceae bacterium]|nr:DUF488 family protein [Stellaceae bacterium]